MKKIFTSFMFLLCGIWMPKQAHSQHLSERVMKQIQLLQSEKLARSPAERRLSSQLLQAYRESKGMPMAQGVALEPVNFPTNERGQLQVDIDAQVTDKLLSEMGSLGMGVVSSSEKYHSVRAFVLPSDLLRLASLPCVRSVRHADQTQHSQSPPPNTPLPPTEGGPLFSTAKRQPLEVRADRVRTYLKKFLSASGNGVVSEGVHTMMADSARAKFSIDGSGIRIGVLSNNFNALKGAATDVQNGELPGVGNPNGYTTPVTVLQDDTSSSGTDEGRAMLQIIHDMAPGAQLYFATADFGQANFAHNIERLADDTNKCDIIVDDVEYFAEPAFQDGIVAQAINQVTKKGVMYFSSAGNGGSVKYNSPSVWEGDFKGVVYTLALPTNLKGLTVHNFGTVGNPIFGDSIVNPGSYYTLKWADALGSSNNDYDLYLISDKDSLVASSTNVQNGTQDPFEEVYSSKAKRNYQLVIVQNIGAADVALRLQSHINGGLLGLTHYTTGRTVGHNAAQSVMTVAASSALTYYPSVFTTASKVENFSGDGPRRIFFNADSTPITPSNFLYSTNGGLSVPKPDISGADGVSTRVANNTSFNNFYGTSAAAPHAASVAALIKSAAPALSATAIANLMKKTAIDLEDAGVDINSGYGMVNPLLALNLLNGQAALPSIVSFSPQTGQIGTAVTIKGGPFTGTSSVSFGYNLASSFTVVDDSTIVAVVGKGSSGKVGITTPVGSASLGGFVFVNNGSRTGDSLALVDLYNSTNGGLWTNRKNWLTKNPISTWYGINLDTSLDRVTKISLAINNLSGTLPNTLGNLSAVTNLYLYSNPRLTGPIPSSIGRMTNLYVLSIFNNSITGSIPDSIGNLTNLSGLYLYNNKLSGTIPTSIGNMSGLNYLELNTNQLTGPIPDTLHNLTNLLYIDLYQNKLSGNIPDLSKLVKLQFLFLYNNQLTGTIPPSLGALTNLYSIRIDSNQLTGGIPDFSRLTKLQNLSLNNNLLTGSIPPTIDSLSSLLSLYLYYNQLSGSIPDLSNLRLLQYLEINHNQFTGSIPPSIAGLTQLVNLDLSTNQLSGRVPDFSKLSLLKYLYLYGNNLTFDGMEGVATLALSQGSYSPQSRVHLMNSGKTLYVSVGGTPSNNTYKWYLNNSGNLVATLTGDSTYTPSVAGNYFVVAQNSIATQLTLYSDTFPVTLPVELVSFTVAEEFGKGIVRWKTGGETNVGYYVVEHSSDGKTFKSVGVVAAKGSQAISSSYDFLDEQSLKGLNYYKLSIVGKDGSVVYSKTLALEIGGDSGDGISIYPNPAGETLTINGSHIAQASIVDNSGRIVQTIVFKDANRPVLSLRGLSKGAYHLNIVTTGGRTSAKELMKE